MPPVQVGLRLRREGKVVKAGTVITYAITAPTGPDDTLSVAMRARPIQDLIKDASLVPDAEYYLEKQIFAPVERLVERIEGVDIIRIAKALGLDTQRYVQRVQRQEGSNGEIAPLESSVNDRDRFRQLSFLVLKCGGCKAQFRFGGIQAAHGYTMGYNGITCLLCQTVMPLLRVNAQLERAIRGHISAYYTGWLECDDAACENRTRQISVYGKRCLGPAGLAHGCRGVMRYSYSDRALYNQLLYFDSIFDIDKARRGEMRPLANDSESSVKINPLSLAQLEALAEQNRTLFEHSREVVNKYLSECGRRYVNMATVFDFML